ncbi:hypothetical protein ACTJN7_17845 [Citrobacter freundii]|uniref:hypothetical protein n=1 Tax=Citrobacter freundii TaxID=546 RepID=UPI003F8BF345
MSRSGSLDLINEVEENLLIMKENQEIKPVKVKSMLEHLRSALEYCANDTFDKHQGQNISQRPDIYFPYGEQKFIDNFFTKKLRISTPHSSPLYNVFNSIQDRNSNSSWLGMMCNLTNEVKHRNPIPLKEDNVVTGMEVSALGFNLLKVDANSTVSFKNTIIGGQKITDFTITKGNLESANNGAPININITQEKKIRFHGIEYEVIPFIQLCTDEIKNFINAAYDILDDMN